MKKRMLALGLCVAMALSMLTGCGQLSNDQIMEKAEKDVVKYLTDGKLKNDTVVMTIGEQEITARYYLYWLAYYMTQMNSYASYSGQSLDLSAEVSEGVTMAQHIQGLADDAAVGYTAMEQKAAEYDVALSEEDQANIQEYIDLQDPNAMLYFCTSAEDQGKVYSQYQVATKLQDVLYGKDGEREATEETLQDYVEDNGIYNCRYILCQVDEDATEEEEQEMKQKCQEIYDELSELEGDARLERFIELQGQNADGNTEEYTFSDSDSLVEGFREKLAELKVGELGMTEKTSYGYFTLLRLDVDMDTVKQDYISSDFSTQMATWSDEADVVKTNAYEKLDPQVFCENLIEFQNVVNEVLQEADSSAEGADPADSSAQGEDQADNSAA